MAHRCLCLASASPRRRELTNALGLDFIIRPVELSEEPLTGEKAAAMVERLSLAKAQAAADGNDCLCLGSDTTVCLELAQQEVIFGKPEDRDDLRRMLTLLMGRQHTVYTGYALYDASSGHGYSGCISVRVHLRNLRETELESYIESGIGDDKAGGYAVQDHVYHLVDAIEGCAAAAMGLPLGAVRQVLIEHGQKPAALTDVRSRCQELTGLPCGLGSDICTEL